MSVLKMDTIHKLLKPHEQFFAQMNLSEGETKRRIEFAYALEIVFFYIFTYIKSLKKLHEEIDKEELEEMLFRRLYDAIDDYGLDIERYDLEPYIEDLAKETIDSTVDDDDDDGDDDDDEEDSKTSKERAKLITQHEVNNVYAKINYEDAKRKGLKHKRWRQFSGVKDGDRISHLMTEGVQLPIDEDFIIEGDRIPYPHAFGIPLKHSINCCCICEYIK